MILTPIEHDVPCEGVDVTELLVKEARQKSHRDRYGLVTLGVDVVEVLAIFASGTFAPPPRVRSRGDCHGSAPHLHVWDYPAEGAAVDGGIIIRLSNVDAHACSLSGYASVQGIDQWNGAVLTAAHTRDSYLGEWESNKPLPLVLHSKGGVASFLVDFVGGNNIRACPYLNTLRVKVPASTTVFTLTSTKLQACKCFQVHPFVPGLSGSNRA